MEGSNESVSWNSTVQHFNSHHVDISLIDDIIRTLRRHRCIVLDGCQGSGKTHCAVFAIHKFANAEKIAFITYPSQWENHLEQSHIILDNVDLSCQKWKNVVQDTCDPSKKRFVIVTLNSKSSHAAKNVELHRYQLQWSISDRKKLWLRYNAESPFHDLHDERMGFPLYCTLLLRWGVVYKTEFNPEQYFELVIQGIIRDNFEEFCRICAVAMAVGESDTLGLKPQDSKHVRNNILCLRNMRKIPGDSIQSDSIFQSEEEIIKHLKWMSLSSENNLRLPALKWLLFHDPGLLLDSISVSALVTFAKLGEGIKHERRLIIDQSYYPAIVQRIACGLCDIDQDILDKSPLLKDSEFLSMLFTQLYIMSSSLKPCDQPNVRFERESLTFGLISNSNGFEKFFRSFLTWKNDKEMLKLKSTLQFYLERSKVDEFPSIFTSKLDSYKDWKDIESKLFAVENWDFADKICLCFASQNFPRYDYHVSLIRKLIGKLSEVEKSSLDEGVDVVEDDVMWSFPLIMARGIVSKCNLDLLSHEHYYCEKAIEHTEFEKKLKNDSPLCIVCFTNSETGRTTSEDLKKLRRSLPDLSKYGISLIVLLVTDPKCKMLSEELSVKNVEIIQVANRREDVREAVTSLLEEKLLCFIEKLTKTRKTLTRNRSLSVQKDAICKRLNRRKYMPRKRKAASQPSKVIPKMMRLILDEYKQSIISYGFWSDKFQIHIKEETKRETIDSIGKELEKLQNTGEFTWETELLSAVGELKVEPHSFVKQGDECFSYHSEQSSENAATNMKEKHQGTVGGFAHLKKSGEERKDELVLFSCDHLYNPTQSMYVKFDQHLRLVGNCTRNFKPRDLSLVVINRKLYDNFDRDFRNSEDEVSSAEIYNCDADELTGEMVHKKGSKTGWTSGIVKHVRHFNDHTRNVPYTVLLIEGIDTPFSVRGDSAAYAIRNGDDPDLQIIEIIGVLRGKWVPPPQEKTLTLYGSKIPKETESLLYEREKKEESDLIVCEDLKSLFDLLGQENFEVIFR